MNVSVIINSKMCYDFLIMSFAERKSIENYKYYNEYLKGSNKIHFELNDDTVPMAYPYWTNDDSLRKKLIDNRIYVATYWTNVEILCQDECLENKLTKCLLPLPVDQRYVPENINKMFSFCN